MIFLSTLLDNFNMEQQLKNAFVYQRNCLIEKVRDLLMYQTGGQMIRLTLNFDLAEPSIIFRKELAKMLANAFDYVNVCVDNWVMNNDADVASKKIGVDRVSVVVFEMYDTQILSRIIKKLDLYYARMFQEPICVYTNPVPTTTGGNENAVAPDPFSTGANSTGDNQVTVEDVFDWTPQNQQLRLNLDDGQIFQQLHPF